MSEDWVRAEQGAAEGPSRLDAERERALLRSALEAIARAPALGERDLSRLLRRYRLPDGGVPSKNQLLRAYRRWCREEGRLPDPTLERRLIVKPTRTISGVAPVTVLTAPYPCPGECVFCPAREGVPKSYLPDEPGARRGASYGFDPYAQTAGRVAALMEIGHAVDKVELLILGGTWSCYPPGYQEWFVRRCLEALNGQEAPSLEAAQRGNERAPHRNVGLVIETRPDTVNRDEVRRLRWLGVTKVQLGVQSLDDTILALNKRGHTVAQTRAAFRLLRLAGFKIVAHWMPNLLGATPAGDLADFERLWADPALRPDELKIYPTALLAGTELHAAWVRGDYHPYDADTLIGLLAACKARIPPYVRLNRLMRDIPAPNIIAGVRRTNLREDVQRAMRERGMVCRCIRCREVRGSVLDTGTLAYDHLAYETDATGERFISAVTPTGRLAGFARLSLPRAAPPLEELMGCAVIRELHVYGPALELGDRRAGAAQHAGLGTRLLEEARQAARAAGFRRLAVIAAVGTRPYYEERGFRRGELYMIADL